MTTLSARALSRRRVLSFGLAAMGTILLTPNFVRSAPQIATPGAVTALAFDGPAILVASTDSLLRQQDDAWTRLDTTAGPSALATHPDRPGTIYAGWHNGDLRRSRDGGQTWAPSDSGLPEAAILSIAVAAQTPETLYAALEGDGLWRSEDGGETWTFVMDRPYHDGEEHDVLSLVSIAHETGMGGIWLYAGTRAGLTRVPDCFCRWQDVVAGDALDALVAGDTSSSAATLPQGEPVEILALAPDAPQRLLAALPTGLWLSTDAGVNWEQTASDPVTALTIDPADPLHVIAADAAGLRVSRDGGSNWSPLQLSKDS